VKQIFNTFTNDQSGAILPMAILASLIGILLIVPVAATVATTARSQGNLLDDTNDAYVAEAGVLAVIEDLVHGADGEPPAPYNYLPPVVNLDGRVPYTTVKALRDASSLPVSSRRLLNYGNAGGPTVTLGTLSVDPIVDGPTAGADLEAEGKKYKYPFVFDVIGEGILPDGTSPKGASFDPNPQRAEFTFISELVDFDPTLTGDVQLDLQAWEESAEVKIYAYEWDSGSGDPTIGNLPAFPIVTRIIDHHHDGDQTEHVHESPKADHHGTADVTFRLSDGALRFVNNNRFIKIKIVATVYSEPDHIHPADANGNGVEQPDSHHWFLKDRPNFQLHLDEVNYALIGPVTVDTRFMTGPIVLNRGAMASGGIADTKVDDLAYYAFESDKGRVEFEVTSEPFELKNLETLVVPFIVRSRQAESQSYDDVEVVVKVYNPDDPLADKSDGFRKVDEFLQTITAGNIDRNMAFEVGQETIDYINSLTTKQVTARISFKSKSEFKVELDRLAFVATSTEVRDTLLADASHRYIDPSGGTEALRVLPPGTSYLLRLNNVQTGLLGINWAFLPMPILVGKQDEQDQISVKVFRGAVLDNGVLVQPGRYVGNPNDDKSNGLVRQAHIHPNNGETYLRTGLFEVEPGIYTVIFTNDSDQQQPDAPVVYTKPFSESGGTDVTWIFGPSYRDYVIQSKFGDVAVRSVVRQAPGSITNLPGTPDKVPPSRQEVFVQSWHGPVGVADEVVDQDKDHIGDTIDGAFENGIFTDEKWVVSRGFTDQHDGGVTFGQVVESAGLEVHVADLSSPDLGILISVTGSGNGQATVRICETTLQLTNGDVFLGSCSPTGIDVHNGPVDIALNSEVAASVPTGGAVIVTKITENQVNLKNTDDEATVIISSHEGTIELAAGDEILIEDGQGLPWLTPTPAGTATPQPTAIPTPATFRGTLVTADAAH